MSNNPEVIDDAHRQDMLKRSARFLEALEAEYPERFVEPSYWEKSVGRQVIEDVAAFFQLTPEDLRGRSRKQVIVDARYCVVYALRKKGWGCYRIAAELGERDHTSILYFTKWLDKCLRRNPKAREFVNLNP